MALATLSIDLEARLAKFEADMGRATRLLEKFGNDAKGSLGAIGQVFAGSFLATGATEAVTRLAEAFPRLIENVAKFQDLAEETGSSAEGLARFQTAADVSGVSIETLAGLTVKLTSNLGKLTDDSKGAGQALANLGIPLEEFRRLSPDQQVERLSKAFNEFADGSAKTSVALALFGKSGAQVLKFFKEYGDGAEASATLTADMIAQADAFADSSAKASSELRQWVQVIAVQTLPAFTALKKGATEVAKEVLGIKDAGGKLKVDTTILDWSEGAAVAIGTVAEALIGIVKTADAVAGSFKSVAADIALPFNVVAAAGGVFQGKTIGEVAVNIRAALDQRNRTVEEANKRYVDLWTYNGTAVTSAIRRQFAAQRELLTTPESLKDTRGIPGDTRPELKPVTVPDRQSREQDSAFQRFMAQIQQKQQLAQAELETGEKLAESDKFRIEILAQLDKAETKLTASQTAAIKKALDEASAVMQLNETRKEEAKAREGAARIDARYQAAAEQRIASIIGENTALEQQIEEIGLVGKALDELKLKRLEQARADAAGDPNTSERELALLERRLSLARSLFQKRDKNDADPFVGAKVAIDGYLEQVSKVGSATRDAVKTGLQTLEDDLVASFAKGKLSVSSFIDFAISEFIRLSVVRPALGWLSTALSFSGGGGGAVVPAANGHAFGASGVIPFASGGIVSAATPFTFGGGRQGVMGEAGPEGILPLKRGKSGKLGVEASGMGGGVSIVQHITVQAGASRNEVMQAAATAKQAAVAEMQDLMRRGRLMPSGA